jgi:hypothetical protein
MNERVVAGSFDLGLEHAPAKCTHIADENTLQHIDPGALSYRQTGSISTEGAPTGLFEAVWGPDWLGARVKPSRHGDRIAGEIVAAMGAIAFTLLLTSPAAPAAMNRFESPPTEAASDVLGASATGPNYQVLDPVTGDGLLRIYRVKSKYGTFTVKGDTMLLQRRKELAALAVLEKQSQTKAFAGALTQAAVAPVEFAAGLVTDPVDSVERTVSGVGEMFDRVSSGLSNLGNSRDSALGSALGVSSQRRKLAALLQIDPYTDFTPLAHWLDQFGRLAAAGGLAVGIGVAFIPGAAGLAVSTSSTVNGLGNLVRDKTSAQLLDINRARLGKLGIPPDTIRKFLANQYYTPADQTVIASALVQLKDAKDLGTYLAWLADVKRRDLAVHLRARSELLADYQLRTRAIMRFVNVRSIPLTEQQDGSTLFLAPLDLVAWTEAVSVAFDAVTADIRNSGNRGDLILEITGTATPMARRELAKLGWIIVNRSGLR